MSRMKILNAVDAIYILWLPVDGLPAPLKLLVHLNPLSYGIDGLRGALSHAFLFGQAIDFAILGGVTAILLGVGSYLFSRIQL